MRHILFVLALSAALPCVSLAADDDASPNDNVDAEPLAPLRRRPVARKAEQAPTPEAAEPAEEQVEAVAEPESDVASSAPAEPEQATARVVGGEELAEARSLLTKKKAELALKRIESLLDLSGLGAELRAQALLTKAEAALALKKPRRDLARRSIVELLRQEPESTRFDAASDKVAALSADVKSEQVIVIHDRITEASTARPLKLKARVLDPDSHVGALALMVRTHPSGVWSELPMRREAASGTWLAIVRDLEKFAPAGSAGSFRFDYYLSAKDVDTDELDTHGSAGDPWVVTVDRPRAPTVMPPAERLSDLDAPSAPARVSSAAYLQATDHDAKMLDAPNPWFKRWTTWAVGAAVVGGAGFASWYYWPQEIKPALTEVTLP